MRVHAKTEGLALPRTHALVLCNGLDRIVPNVSIVIWFFISCREPSEHVTQYTYVGDFNQSCKHSVDSGGLSYVFQLFVAMAATMVGHADHLVSVPVFLDGLVLPVMMVCEDVYMCSSHSFGCACTCMHCCG